MYKRSSATWEAKRCKVVFFSPLPHATVQGEEFASSCTFHDLHKGS